MALVLAYGAGFTTEEGADVAPDCFVFFRVADGRGFMKEREERDDLGFK